ncbi:MAG: glycosyltransferase family 4 protein [Patiriisocius sp.]|uniref:glycosyltransferase family 4 protein n=1 Tax=Patiriisocius sp. TaxID=2822396 RepID=UPI003EF3449F
MCKLIVVSELYYPEQNATGYFLTGIAEGLAESGREVSVLCAQPTYNQRGIKAPAEEIRNGVKIRRVKSVVCNPRKILGKIINILSVSVGLFYAGLRTVKRGDEILVVTNPPMAPYLLWLVARLKGAKFCLLVHDVYPDVFVPLGMMRQGGLPFRLFNFINSKLYRSSDHIVTLGRDMKELVDSKLCREGSPPVSIIPNWGEVNEIQPQKKSESVLLRSLGLQNKKFIALYSGNHGRTHNLPEWADIAEHLGNKDINFLFVGEGSGKAALERKAKELDLSNIMFNGFLDRSELADSLNSGDVGLISFNPGMEGVSVPSRLYNLLAAGTPILAVCGKDSELAKVVLEEDAGWVIEPGDSQAIASLLLEISSDLEELAIKGKNARRAAVKKYSRQAVIEKYEKLLNELNK